MKKEKVKKPWHKKWWVWIVVIIIIAIAVSPDEEKEEKVAKVSTNNDEESSPATEDSKDKVKKNEEKKEDKEKEEKVKEEDTKSNDEATKVLNEYFEFNFSGTSWYSLIEKITVEGSIAKIKTNVFGDKEGKDAVKNIPTSVWMWTNANDADYKITDVNIYDKDNDMLISETNPME